MGSSMIVTAVVPLLITAVIAVIILMFVRRTLTSTGLIGGKSKEQKEDNARLMQTGRKAKAIVMSAQPTGVIVNSIYIQTILGFEIRPLDGGQGFSAQKKAMVSQLAMPRMGDAWPCWFDPADHSHFAVAQPVALTNEQAALWREFGIPHPMDPANVIGNRPQG